MSKQDILMARIARLYGDIDKAMADNISEDEFKDFLNFCEGQRSHDRGHLANFNDWRIFVELKNKIHHKGIQSVLMRSDVYGTGQGVEQVDDKTFVKFISVHTKYGCIQVVNNNQIHGVTYNVISG